jgi:hypothetical protein
VLARRKYVGNCVSEGLKEHPEADPYDLAEVYRRERAKFHCSYVCEALSAIADAATAIVPGIRESSLRPLT